MSKSQPQTIEERLDLYRTLLRRDGGISELNRLVDLLESELDGDPGREPRKRGACEPA